VFGTQEIEMQEKAAEEKHLAQNKESNYKVQ
jgi:hypothetical protein